MTTKTETKTTKKVVIERKISSDIIGKELASRITGKILLDVDDLYDPKTGKFLPESELKAKGAIFVTVDFAKVLTYETDDTVKKSRITKEPTPYILKKFKAQQIVNIDWSNYVNRRNGEGFTFIPKKERSNKVVNFDENCRGIGITTKGFFTLNGVFFNSIEPTRYFDENGKEYPDKVALQNEYFKTTYKADKKSRQREADKHGIDVKIDPQYRTARIDNCKSVRCFGFDYKPTDNPFNF